MTQRIFDVENAEDMALLWSILPDEVVKLTPATRIWITQDAMYFNISAFNINWHLKTEIERPIQEATEADIGKLCKFWAGKDSAIGILKEIGDHSTVDVYLMDNSINGIWFVHCRRLTKKEIEELI